MREFPMDGDILEIGPGNGDFLLSLASEFPFKKIAAIEIKERRFRKVSRRIEKAGLKNVTLVWGDARVMLPKYFEGVQFEKIFILFSDPWPKRRHAHHRLLDGNFLALLSKYLKEKGELLVATDSKEYIDSIVQAAEKVPAFELKPWDLSFQTYFQQKWKRMGKEIYALLALNIQHARPKATRRPTAFTRKGM